MNNLQVYGVWMCVCACNLRAEWGKDFATSAQFFSCITYSPGNWLSRFLKIWFHFFVIATQMQYNFTQWHNFIQWLWAFWKRTWSTCKTIWKFWEWVTGIQWYKRAICTNERKQVVICIVSIFPSVITKSFIFLYAVGFKKTAKVSDYFLHCNGIPLLKSQWSRDS